jgi:hypothetical protein
MGRDTKRRKKVLIKGAASLKRRSQEHIEKAPYMRTPELRNYALKEAEIFEKQAQQKLYKTKKLKKKKN